MGGEKKPAKDFPSPPLAAPGSPRMGSIAKPLLCLGQKGLKYLPCAEKRPLQFNRITFYTHLKYDYPCCRGTQRGKIGKMLRMQFSAFSYRFMVF